MENSQWERNNNSTASTHVSTNGRTFIFTHSKANDFRSSCDMNIQCLFLLWNISHGADTWPHSHTLATSLDGSPIRRSEVVPLRHLSCNSDPHQNGWRHPRGIPYTHVLDSITLNYLMRLWDKPSTFPRTDSNEGDRWIWPALCTSTRELKKVGKNISLRSKNISLVFKNVIRP